MGTAIALCLVTSLNCDLKAENNPPQKPKSKLYVVKGNKSSDDRLLRPTEMELKGSERRLTISSNLGPMELRWQRDVERFFGKTPERAVIDASQAVNRALNKGGFPVAVTALTMKWNIIFFGENLPSGQVPQSLISGCHPGWMTGNSSEVNIYIRAQAVVAGCSGGAPPSSTVADARLAQVIVHEIGHGIEGAIGRGRLLGERYRAEGFATWFEQYVAEFSPLLRGENIPRTFKKLALQRLKYYPGSFTFQGSSYDYAYSSMYFVAISKRFGVRGLFAVYDEMIKNQVSFFNAIERRFNWSPSHLEKEVSRILN